MAEYVTPEVFKQVQKPGESTHTAVPKMVARGTLSTVSSGAEEEEEREHEMGLPKMVLPGELIKVYTKNTFLMFICSCAGLY